MTEASPLGILLDETPGVIGVVLGTATGDVRAVVGSVLDGESGAATAASIAHELAAIGFSLGVGELGAASVKSRTSAFVFARQAGAVVAIELEPNRPLGDLEVKLATRSWAPDDPLPAPEPVPTALRRERTAAASHPPPLPRSSAQLAASQIHQAVPLPLAVRANALAPMKSVGSGPVFAGDLEEFGIPDLLEFLRHSQRTGLLICTTTAGTGTVHLLRGMVVSADSPSALDLRQQLLTSPDLGAEQRRVLATLPMDSFRDDRVDDAIVARDLVSADEVERARIARIYSAFREMIGWSAGRFSFDPGVRIAANPAISIAAQSILLQLCQEHDEQAR
jgi:hypothetical protein